MRPSSWRERSATPKYLAGLGELPVFGDLQDCFLNGGRLDGGREVFGEWAGVVGIGAELAGIVARDGGDAGGFRVGRCGGGVVRPGAVGTGGWASARGALRASASRAEQRRNIRDLMESV